VLGTLKPVVWIGSSKADLSRFPPEVKEVMGYAVYLAQTGGKHPAAKPLRGHGGAGVLEVVEDFDGNTYRAVYTVKLAGVIYVLHAFQKKAKQGIATPKRDLDLIERRLTRAQQIHREMLEKGAKK
jgi:phage-related protein